MQCQVLTAASMKMAVFLVVAPCTLVKVYRRFRGACCLHHQGYESNIALMKAGNTSETSVNFYQTLLRNNPEDSHLHTDNVFFYPRSRLVNISSPENFEI
jgi:hypothetical protein